MFPTYFEQPIEYVAISGCNNFLTSDGQAYQFYSTYWKMA
jgi:hypothetical protein